MDRLPTDAPFTYFFREKSKQKSFLQSCALPLARRVGKGTTKVHPSPEVQSVGADVLIGPNWAKNFLRDFVSLLARREGKMV